MYCYFIRNGHIYHFCFPFLSILIIVYLKGFKYSRDFNPVIIWGFEHNSIDRLLVY